MRDWMLALAPLVLIIYFLLFPEQFQDLLRWFLRVH